MGNLNNLTYRFLDTNGDGTGTKNANGNYASVAEEFYFQAEDNGIQIHRMIVDIVDTSGILQDEYGNLGSALTNGYTVKLIDTDGSTEIDDLCDGVAIKANQDFGRYCYDVDLTSWGNTPTNESVKVRWTFEKSGVPLILDKDQRISITLNDDFSGLIEHYFMLQGHL